jgi:hypothetical protein
VEISAGLAADLALLTAALEDPATDIMETVRQLARAAVQAIPSYIGLSLLIETDRHLVPLSAFEMSAGPDDVLTSLTLPLGLWLPIPTGAKPAATIVLTLYASVLGAFVDLASDISWLSAEDGAAGLDQALPSTISAAAVSIVELALINQAIGLLIGRGYTPDEAERELRLTAVRDGVEASVSAAALLAELDELDEPESDRSSEV